MYDGKIRGDLGGNGNTYNRLKCNIIIDVAYVMYLHTHTHDTLRTTTTTKKLHWIMMKVIIHRFILYALFHTHLVVTESL